MTGANEPEQSEHRSGARPWRADALRRRFLAVADAATLVAVVLAFQLVEGDAWLTATLAFLVALAGLIVAKLLGLYDRDHRVLWHVTGDELPGLATWSVAVTGITDALLQLAGQPIPSSPQLLAIAVTSLVLGYCLRAAARRLWRQVTPPERIVILGSGSVERAVRRKFEVFANLHAEFPLCTGRLSFGGTYRGGDPGWILAELGVVAEGVDRILVAAASPEERLIADLVPYCRRHGIKLGLVPPARGMFGTAVQLDHLAELPIVQYNTWDISMTTMLGKRVLDICLGGVMLILATPLIGILALAVRLDSAGPVLFTQRRAGQGGRPFTVLKLRSMTADAEQRFEEVVGPLTEPAFKLAHDPRVTTIGRFLRRTSLDELPQLLNIIKGDMSLVGPRPEELRLVARYPAEARGVRLAVRPGLTGPMQVFGRGTLSFDERLAVEREYVENLSLGRDFRILGRTASAVMRGEGSLEARAVMHSLPQERTGATWQEVS